MRSLFFAVACALLGVSPASAQCSADACLRQVRGPQCGGQAQMILASNQCVSAFQTSITTVTPTAVTLTIVVTSTTTTAPVTLDVTVTTTLPTVIPVSTQGPLKKRDLGVAIPPYASSCVDVAQYSSACSCLGVLTAQSTVTVTASTKTVFTTFVSEVAATATTTTTSLVSACPVAYTADFDQVAFPAPGLSNSESYPDADLNDCCVICYETIGCNFFYFIPADGGCVVISNAPGTGISSECPNGSVNRTLNLIGSDDSFFGDGPCSTGEDLPVSPF